MRILCFTYLGVKFVLISSVDMANAESVLQKIYEACTTSHFQSVRSNCLLHAAPLSFVSKTLTPS